MAIERKQFTYTPFTYKEYEKSDEVKAADKMQNDLATKLQNWKPAEFSRNEEYQNLFTAYQNRPDFTYDFNADALYQQYKDKYIKQGKMAMADTMGQAAAMTGGYGNSYAQTVGNQAYQASLQNLNDIIPELYQMAYDRHNQKGQDMLNMLGLLSNERDYERNLDNDAYSRLASNLDYATTNAQNLFNRDFGMHSDEQKFLQTEHGNTEKYKYQDVADANAFAQWLEEHDLNERQVALAEKQYADVADQTTYSYRGTTKTGKGYDNGTLTNAQVKQLQTALGVDADGYYGDISKGKADGLSAVEAYKKFVGKIEGSSNNSDAIIKNVQNYTSKEGQADYLAKQVEAGKISESEALDILDQHGVVGIQDRTWQVVDDGGWNWFGAGIDANAVVRDEFGNEMSLADMRKELKKTMSTKEANAWIKKLEDQLGI